MDPGRIREELAAFTEAGIQHVVSAPWRRDLGGLLEAYTEVAKRLGIMSEGERPQGTGPVLVKG